MFGLVTDKNKVDNFGLVGNDALTGSCSILLQRPSGKASTSRVAGLGSNPISPRGFLQVESNVKIGNRMATLPGFVA